MSLPGFLEDHMLVCSTKRLLGIDCPGCGMQRAFIALLRGDLQESLQLNASLIPFLVTISYAAIHLVFGLKNGARGIVILFSITAGIMLFHFIFKLTLHS